VLSRVSGVTQRHPRSRKRKKNVGHGTRPVRISVKSYSLDADANGVLFVVFTFPQDDAKLSKFSPNLFEVPVDYPEVITVCNLVQS
jgi:hypothetical protein